MFVCLFVCLVYRLQWLVVDFTLLRVEPVLPKKVYQGYQLSTFLGNPPWPEVSASQGPQTDNGRHWLRLRGKQLNSNSTWPVTHTRDSLVSTGMSITGLSGTHNTSTEVELPVPMKAQLVEPMHSGPWQDVTESLDAEGLS